MAKGWLRDLEEKVRDASEALRSLRDENETLQARVSELETRLANSRPGSDGGGDADSSDAAWQQERDEIRERVETLVDHLSSLLSEG